MVYIHEYEIFKYNKNNDKMYMTSIYYSFENIKDAKKVNPRVVKARFYSDIVEITVEGPMRVETIENYTPIYSYDSDCIIQNNFLEKVE